MARRKVAILGSTGSIGTQALDVIAAHPERFEVVALAAGANRSLLEQQARIFQPGVVVDARSGADNAIEVLEGGIGEQFTVHENA